ncbi:hypothetical protein B0T19DRAFT_274845 [Cercophora scortea]|uniref:Uncharacterized protein n=1 Tax=Cercophora scortea TaxID=314031 RepID=A0AAE0I7F5_9PEZI|nr:hypothetical protein B0T19DRAFT_274845 [Cercophora scortea]
MARCRRRRKRTDDTPRQDAKTPLDPGTFPILTSKVQNGDQDGAMAQVVLGQFGAVLFCLLAMQCMTVSDQGWRRAPMLGSGHQSQGVSWQGSFFGQEVGTRCHRDPRIRRRGSIQVVPPPPLEKERTRRKKERNEKGDNPLVDPARHNTRFRSGSSQGISNFYEHDAISILHHLSTGCPVQR